MASAEDYAEATAAFERGMQDFRDRQDYYQQRPGEGVPAGYDPGPPDPFRPPRKGLGYSTPPDPAAVFVADRPGLVPQPVPVPPATDPSAGPALSGMTHGGMPPAAAARGESVIDGTVPRRRSLLGRLLGRR